jgi:hypothetical protein
MLDPKLPWEMCGCGRVVPANEFCVCELGEIEHEAYKRRYPRPESILDKPCDVCGEELGEPLQRYQKGEISGHEECVK